MSTFGRLCGIRGCNRSEEHRGFCNAHYQQWFYGTPGSRRGPQKAQPYKERSRRGTITGEVVGTHRGCGGQLVGLVCRDGAYRLPWAECDRCHLRGEPV